ncbi:hypothetical protein IX299_001277 [Porphyromonas levii]|nr:hypothetical protein [Porphyromonas levii]
MQVFAPCTHSGLTTLKSLYVEVQSIVKTHFYCMDKEYMVSVIVGI